MITTDLGYGRGWLRADAAASIRRIDAALGHPIALNDAGRTNAEQWDMWRKYGWPRAAYPGTSTHETGIAIDTDERPLDLLAEHGWYRPFDWEPWHFKYVPTNDEHRFDPAPAGHATERPAPPEPDTPEEDTMKMMGYINPDDGRTWYAEFDTSSGFFHPWVSSDQVYIRGIADKWTAEGIPLVTEKHWDGIKAECDRISGRVDA